MTPEASPPRSSGQMVRVGQSLPAIEMDCSDWPRAAGPRSVGQFVRVCESLPLIEMEFAPETEIPYEPTLAEDTDSILERVKQVPDAIRRVAAEDAQARQLVRNAAHALRSLLTHIEEHGGKNGSHTGSVSDGLVEATSARSDQ